MMMENDGWMIDWWWCFGFAVFDNAESFNSDLSNWNTERVTNMQYSKLSCLYCVVETYKPNHFFFSLFAPTNHPSASAVFFGAAGLDTDLSKWDISKVKDVTSMFSGAITQNFCGAGFYGPIGACMSNYQSSKCEQNCTACGAGKYARNSSFGKTIGDFCLDCPAGLASNATGRSSRCDNCSPGFFTESPGAASCDSCPEGWYQERMNKPFCSPCPPRQISDTVPLY